MSFGTTAVPAAAAAAVVLLITATTTTETAEGYKFCRRVYHMLLSIQYEHTLPLELLRTANFRQDMGTQNENKWRCACLLLLASESCRLVALSTPPRPRCQENPPLGNPPLLLLVQ